MKIKSKEIKMPERVEEGPECVIASGPVDDSSEKPLLLSVMPKPEIVLIVLIALFFLITPYALRLASGNNALIGKESYYSFLVVSAMHDCGISHNSGCSRLTEALSYGFCNDKASAYCENSTIQGTKQKDWFYDRAADKLSATAANAFSSFFSKPVLSQPKPKLYHYIAYFASGLFGIKNALIILPIVFGIASAVLFFLLIKQFFFLCFPSYFRRHKSLSVSFSVLVTSMLCSSPAFIYFFNSSAEYCIAAFSLLASLYFFKESKALSALFFALLCLNGYSYFLLFSVLLFSAFFIQHLMNKKSHKKAACKSSNLKDSDIQKAIKGNQRAKKDNKTGKHKKNTGFFSSSYFRQFIIFFFLALLAIAALQSWLSFSETSFSRLEISKGFLTEFGALPGFSIFMLFTAFIGIVASRKIKGRIAVIIIAFLLFFAFLSYKQSFLFLNFILVLFSGIGFLALIRRKWELNAVRSFSLVLLIIGFAFASFSFISVFSSSEPGQSLVDALLFIRSKAPENSTALTSPDYAVFVKAIANREPVFSESPLCYKSRAYSKIFRSRSLGYVKEFFKKHKVSAVLLNSEMQPMLYNKKSIEGLPFVLENHNSYVYSAKFSDTKVWLVRDG